MNRRDFLRLTTVSALSLTAGKLITGCAHTPEKPVSDQNPLRGLTIVDAHAHPNQFFEVLGYQARASDKSSDLTYIKELHMAACSFAAVGDLVFRSRGGLRGSEFDIASIQLKEVEKMAQKGSVKIVRTASDVPTEPDPTNMTRAILGIEGGDCLGGDPAKLEPFFEMGVRCITLVHYSPYNHIGDTMTAPATYNGLTEKGTRIVERMQEMGILVDVAHVDYKTLQDVSRISTKPIIDSHTSLSSLKDPSDAKEPWQKHLRTWKEMELIVKTGGVVCTWPGRYTMGSQKRETFHDWANETLEMKKRFGMEHVGLGTDGGGMLPAFTSGYRDVRDLRRLAQAMEEVGLSREDIAAYFGGNYSRVLRTWLSR